MYDESTDAMSRRLPLSERFPKPTAVLARWQLAGVFDVRRQHDAGSNDISPDPHQNEKVYHA